MDNYDYVFPLTFRKKYGINYLYQPYFNQQLGVFTTKKLTEEVVENFINAIPNKFKFIEINLNSFNKFSRKDFKIKTSLTLELDLIESYEDLKNKYSENTIRNIKKAEKNNLSYKIEESPDEVIKAFTENKGKEIEQLKEEDYNKLKKLFNVVSSKGKGQVWKVFKEKEFCAGALFIESNNKVIFIFSGSTQLAKETGAMPFLIDKFIEKNSQRNLILDFGGSNDKNLARFYKSFGSNDCFYLQIKKNKLPFIIKWLKG